MAATSRRNPVAGSPSSAATASRSRAPTAPTPRRPTRTCSPPRWTAWSTGSTWPGERLDVVIGGAVLKHSRDFNLMRECVLGSALSPYTPAFDLQQACGTGLQAAIAAADGIAAGRYEVGRRRRGGHHLRRADRASATTCAAPCSGCAGPSPTSTGSSWSASCPPSLGVEIPTNGEPRTGLSMGEHAADHRQADGHQARRPGRAGRRQPPQHGRRLRPRLLRRSRHPVPRAVPRQQPAAGLVARRSWPSSSRCSA